MQSIIPPRVATTSASWREDIFVIDKGRHDFQPPTPSRLSRSFLPGLTSSSRFIAAFQRGGVGIWPKSDYYRHGHVLTRDSE